MKRRTFILKASIVGLAFLIPAKKVAASFLKSASAFVSNAIRSIILMIDQLKTEKSNIVKKTLNGRMYERDPSVFYPYENAILDKETSCQVFFHAHRPNEYGHFHTFINNPNGELVHLVMISMDKKGLPITISTLNQWVTGDYFVDSETLKQLFLKFKMDHELFPDKE